MNGKLTHTLKKYRERLFMQDREWLLGDTAEKLIELYGIHGFIHILPEDDIKPHIEDEITCPCKPNLKIMDEVGYAYIIHNSFDGREYDEPDNIKYKKKE